MSKSLQLLLCLSVFVALAASDPVPQNNRFSSFRPSSGSFRPSSEDQHCHCHHDLHPVCGYNSRTYLSRCHADCAHVQVRHEGKCFSSGGDHHCHCSSRYQPVCGSNGRTYSNRCKAECAHVRISYHHRCH